MLIKFAASNVFFFWGKVDDIIERQIVVDVGDWNERGLFYLK